MAGKLVHVWHDHRLAFRSASAANALPDFDAHASRLALKRSEHQLAIFRKIESRPIQVRQRMKDQCREVRGIRDQIAFAG